MGHNIAFNFIQKSDYGGKFADTILFLEKSFNMIYDVTHDTISSTVVVMFYHTISVSNIVI